MLNHSLHAITSRHAFRFISILSIVALISCKQRGSLSNPLLPPIFKETPIIVPKEVNPARVDEMKTNFDFTLRKIQQESAAVLAASASAKKLNAKRRAKTYIVTFRPEAVALTGGENPDTPLLAAGGTIKTRHNLISAVTVEFPNAKNDTHMLAIAKFLEDSLHVASVEPDIVVKANVSPNDTRFSELWGLKNNGTSNIDIRATNAWDKTTGSRKIVVGIIDSGIDYNHPDLAANIWTNPGESGLDSMGRDKKSNSVDDDSNGYIDDYRGWDFVSNDNTPMDLDSHGTHVAGTIGAVGNNSSGVTGVNWQASLVALRFLDENGEGYISDAVKALEYAVKMRFFATNNSWGGGGYSAAMNAAIVKARDAGQLFIAAAGNESANNETTDSYPANYDQANVISVAAVDRNGILGWFSNYGSKKVHVAAPGVEILSTIPNSSYQSYQGTSMAAPHVTGAAMLMKANDPSLDYTTIKQRLISSVTSISGLAGKCVAGGIINIDAAINTMPDTTPPSTPKNLSLVIKGMLNATLSWTPSADDGRIAGVQDYLIKKSSKLIETESDWENATSITDATMSLSPDKVTASINLPAGSQVFISVRARDFSNNISTIVPAIAVNLLPISLKNNYKANSIPTFPTTPWTAENDTVRGQVFSDGSGSYAANTNRWLRLPAIPLRGQDKLLLRFWHRYELEKNFDKGYITLESDGQTTWLSPKFFTGTSNGWELAEIDLTQKMIELQQLAPATNVTIGFLLTSDQNIQYDGWYLDDVSILYLPSAFTANPVPENSNFERSFSIQLSQTGEQDRVKISQYGSSFQQGTPTDCSASITATDKSLSQPISFDVPELGRSTLCIKAPLQDYSESIVRVYSWNRVQSAPPSAIISGLPLGESNLRSVSGTISGQNVAFYAYYLAAISSTSCQDGSYDNWLPISSPISIALDKEQKNILCIKGKSNDGIIQSNYTTAEWISDFTPPTGLLSGQPPISSTSLSAEIMVSGNGATSYVYATGISEIDCKTYSGVIPIATPILLSLIKDGDGPRSLCVKATDAAGNKQSSPTVLTWTQDTVSQPLGFGGLPSSSSNAKQLEVTIIAPELGTYRYHITAGSTCNLTSLQQASPRNLTQKINDVLPTEDGAYTLCAVLTDQVGNNQDPPTSFTWNKDTVPPVTALANLPPLTSSQTSLNVTVSGNGVTAYKYAIAISSTTCSETSYSANQSITIPITSSLSGIGRRTLCVKGIDAAGNVQVSPTTYTWTLVSQAIIRPDLLRVPLSPNSKSLLNIGVSSPSGQNIISYKYGFAPGFPPSCARVQKWSADQSIGKLITDNLGTDQGYKTLCVIAKNVNGSEQLTPTAATWIKVNGAQINPAASYYATIKTTKTATSTFVTITRPGTTASQLPRQIFQTKLCKLDMTTGAFVANGCTSGSYTYASGTKTMNITLPKVASGEYLFVVLPATDRVEPLRISL